MRYPTGSATAALVVALGLLIGCTNPTADEPVGSPSEAAGRITPNCERGCIEPDPDPSPTAIGIFLSTAVTDVTCFDGSQSDPDGDGISEFCEKNLASAFAPQLAMTKGSDNLGREPKLAVRKLGTNKARIMYLLSYYVDRGPTTSWCNNNVGSNFDPAAWRAACEGHDGDSEWITLDVYYNRTTMRWILDGAVLSAHTSPKTITRGTATHPKAFIYPVNPGGYPRVYVAYQKHANYVSDAACDSGAILGTDSCQADTFERVYAGDNVNIRSRAAHTAAQDCWPSTNPIYSSNGIKECYWTTKKFLGWHVGSTGSGSEYSPKLTSMGF